MSLPRIITQIVLQGTTIVGKAFVEAWREVAASASVNDAARAATAGGPKANAMTRQTGMSFEEATMILHVDKESPSPEEVLKRYEQLFKVNAPAREGGQGSFYLQSKVFRAKERIDMELAEREKLEI
ncbi:putative mitochondria-associated granulocyte macrophage CSF signaling molecule [Gonapodya prolifera JEL478]|uniref:Mitochondrial import inner membrane translocase subunit TIM16 n=1 Tax=Gonapodya prolifera (strain JEL478) TaxID=1344416 RepID=A0A139ABR2_GONPJ|nr:putative mitochondria-associated granulocyte macrophage CSF signaling molecule [Gonapodya prolifera JEL478]|eukprot:KXS14272.1 putative mitochondria-associated granulocyte macrophage CSF signaling molecule [Gonapodya prolifera JEL478]